MSNRLLRDYLPPLFWASLALGGTILAYEGYHLYRLKHPPQEALIAFTISAGRYGLDMQPANLLDLHQRACEAGYPPSCSPQAWVSETKPDWRLQKMAIDLDQRATDGDPLALLVRAWAVGEDLWPGDTINLSLLNLLEGACEEDYPAGCVSFGLLVEQGRGLTANPERARELFAQACEEGDGEGCFQLARLVSSGEGENLREQGCNQGSAAACMATGDIGRACEGGLVAACEKNGNKPAISSDLAQNISRCDAGDAEGCDLAGYQFMAGGDTLRSYENAAARFTRGCELGRGASCAALGELYNMGRGVSMDVQQAASLYQQAVDMGAATRAAYRLSGLYRYGLGVTKDETKELALSQLACDAMDGRGCYNLARLQTEGTTIPHDTTLAQYNLRLACTLGLKLACK